MNIERWIRTRVFRLPARYNSVSDILNDPGAKALLRKGFRLLEDEIRRLFLKGGPVESLQGQVWYAVERGLDLDQLPVEAVVIMRDFVNQIFLDEEDLLAIEARLISELKKRLKL